MKDPAEVDRIIAEQQRACEAERQLIEATSSEVAIKQVG